MQDSLPFRKIEPTSYFNLVPGYIVHIGNKSLLAKEFLISEFLLQLVRASNSRGNFIRINYIIIIIIVFEEYKTLRVVSSYLYRQ